MAVVPSFKLAQPVPADAADLHAALALYEQARTTAAADCGDDLKRIAVTALEPGRLEPDRVDEWFCLAYARW